MAERCAVCGGGTCRWLEWPCLYCGHGNLDVLLATPSSIVGGWLRRHTRDGPGPGGDAHLLDALAGASTPVHTPADAGLRLPAALVRTGTCVRTATVSAPAAVDGFMGESTRRICTGFDAPCHVCGRQRS